MPGSEPENDDREGEWMQHHWHHNSSPGLYAGLILVMLGVVFFLSSQGLIGRGDWWKYFIIGLGSLFLIEVLVRYIQPAYRRLKFGKLVAGLILISIGFASLTGIGNWWPLILIAIGLAMLVNALFRRR
ncbi:MAG: rane protein of unknown function [Dehalococcoidales bacterium]|nr:rane protein of unknown function [Dehalococcoidales bacterium]